MILLWNRLIFAATTTTTPHGWFISLLVLLATAAVTGAYGMHTGFLTRSALPPRSLCVRIWLTAWLTPALVEEVLFRVLPLPHPTEGRPFVTVVFAALLALLFFVAGHPLRTLVKPSTTNRVFTDIRFLILATVLGVGCSALYLTTGSLWVPVILHYILVASWLVFFGGWKKVTPVA